MKKGLVDGLKYLGNNVVNFRSVSGKLGMFEIQGNFFKLHYFAKGVNHPPPPPHNQNTLLRHCTEAMTT